MKDHPVHLWLTLWIRYEHPSLMADLCSHLCTQRPTSILRCVSPKEIVTGPVIIGRTHGSSHCSYSLAHTHAQTWDPVSWPLNVHRSPHTHLSTYLTSSLNPMVWYPQCLEDHNAPECHNLFPELSPTDHICPVPPRLTPFLSYHALQSPNWSQLCQLYCGSLLITLQTGLEHWSECTPQPWDADTFWDHVAIMWWSCNHVPPGPPHCRPPIWQTWDLRVPTLFLSNIFPSYCCYASLSASQCCALTCSHSQLGGWLYAPVSCYIPVLFTPMWQLP